MVIGLGHGSINSPPGQFPYHSIKHTGQFPFRHFQTQTILFPPPHPAYIIKLLPVNDNRTYSIYTTTTPEGDEIFLVYGNVSEDARMLVYASNTGQEPLWVPTHGFVTALTPLLRHT